MRLELGDRVSVIDESLEGVVVEINDNEISLECIDGFRYIYKKSQLLKISENGVEFEIDERQDLENLLLEKSERKQLPISHRDNKIYIDLHIEELAPQMCFKNQHETLLFQLNAVNETIEYAIKKRNRRIIFIHGVGKGRLRQEIRNYLSEKHTSIEFFDGNYQEFGNGATEVIIHDFSPQV